MHEQFRKNIRDISRNRAYTRVACIFRKGEHHNYAMTDDFIVDINIDTHKVNMANPTDGNYRELFALMMKMGDAAGQFINQREMYFLKSTLTDLIKVQIMRSEL